MNARVNGRRKVSSKPSTAAACSLIAPERTSSVAHSEARPLKVIDRGEVEIDRVDRQRRRHGAAAQEGETSRLALERERGARFEITIGNRIGRIRHGW